MTVERDPFAFGRRTAPPGPVEVSPPRPSLLERAPAPTAADGSERRAAPRTRSLLSGKLVIAGGALSPDCAIRDLSLTGARIRLPATVDLPRDVGLLVIKNGVLFDATVVWRKEDLAGLAFTGRHDLATSIDPALRAVRVLWKELAPR